MSPEPQTKLSPWATVYERDAGASNQMMNGVDLDTIPAPRYRIASCYTHLPAASGHGFSRKSPSRFAR
jgi:hypothetical protein